MSTYNTSSSGFRPQGGYGGRGGGGGRRNNDNRGYRSHGGPGIYQNVPRPATAVNVQNPIMHRMNPPLIHVAPGTGPIARAPTTFPQHLGVVPQAINPQLLQNVPQTHQQAVAMAAAAGLSHQYFLPTHQQAQFAANQPINLGITTGGAQLAGVTPTQQQISSAIPTMPPLINQINQPVNTPSTGRGLNANSQPFRPPAHAQQPPPTKRQSKAIKIIDPSTHKEVSVKEGKTDVQQPSLTESVQPTAPAAPLPTSVPVSVGVATPVVPPGNSLVQDFKRRVHESNATGPVTQGAVPVTQKRPPPNAIITRPDDKESKAANKTGTESAISQPPSTAAVTVEASQDQKEQQQQQQEDVPPIAATVAPPISESTQVIRDEFRQKVQQAAYTPPTVTKAPPTLIEEKKAEEEAPKVTNGKSGGETTVEAAATKPEPAAEPVPPSVDTTGEEKEVKVEESKSASEDVVKVEKTDITEGDTTSSVAVSSEAGKAEIEQTPTVEPKADVPPPTIDTDSKPTVGVAQDIPEATPPETSDVIEGKSDETSQTLPVEKINGEAKHEEVGKPEQKVEEKEKTIPEKIERKEAEPVIPVKPVSEPPPQAQVEPKEDKTVKDKPEIQEEEKVEQIPKLMEVEKATPTEPVPTESSQQQAESSDKERTEKPPSEVTAVPKPVIQDKQEQQPAAAEAKEKEQPSQPPKPVKPDEPPPPAKASSQVKPVDKGRTSPPTAAPTSDKPKEAVKPAEPVKQDKKDKDQAPQRAANVPATARQVLPAAEPQSSFGRTMYERDFLLSFKAVCVEVPPELKKFDVFHVNREHQQVPPMPSDRDYRGFHREYSRDREYNQPGSKKGRRDRDRDGRRGSSYQQVSKEPVDLHKAENRWVRQAPGPSGEDGETEDLFRKFQSILNKLTPQKFKNLAEQALNLKIDSEQRLKGCIDKIFTKALEEPKFSIAYANLCKVMSTIKVEVIPEEGKAKVVTFRRVLLTKCQQEFEKDKKDDDDREKMLNAIKETEDADKKKQLETELFVMESKNRKRSLGNIRFIGELFKLQMLSETIMHECIVRLLRSSSDEESLECFAGLITTTGKDLDKPEAKTRIDSYFSRIAEIIKKGKVPARIKFMLQDVQELRGNKWVPRVRQEQSLKTIDQIHHEAKVEQEKEKQFVAQAMAGSMKHGGGGRDSRRGSLKPDEWQGGKGDRDRDRRDKDRDREKPKEKLDANRLKVLLKHREKSKDSGPPTLGPATLRPQGWGRGGAGAGTTVQEPVKSDKDKRPSRTSSGITKRSEKDKLPVGRGSGSGPKRSSSTPTPDSQAEKALAIQAVQQAMSKTGGKSQGTSGGGKAMQSKPVHDKMDEDTVRRKTTTIVNELVQNKDFKEAIECVQEMKSPGKMNFLVSEAINHSLEKSAPHRQFSGRLFSKLISGRHISEAKFMEGLNEVLEFAEDIAIDIPKFWDYLGEILSPVVVESSLSLSFLSSVVPSLITSGKAGTLAVKILVQCRSQMASDDEVTSLWTSSSLKWSALGVTSEDVGEFLSRHNLAYLQCSSQPSSSSQPLEYVKELSQKFGAIDVTNDDIFDWIEDHCPVPIRSTPEFVATVTTAIVNATVTGEGSSAQFREETFKKRAISIKKYVDENKDLQLRVLYALQIAVAHLQHPPGMLNTMFNAIYDLEIVGEDMFRKWRDKGTEQFGKGAAVLTVKSFFDWLDSCETESDEET